MSLTSSSTVADALAQYIDNQPWEGDSTRASNVLQAIRFLRVKRATMTRTQDTQISWSSLEAEEEKLTSVVAAASANRSTFTRGKCIEY